MALSKAAISNKIDCLSGWCTDGMMVRFMAWSSTNFFMYHPVTVKFCTNGLSAIATILCPVVEYVLPSSWNRNPVCLYLLGAQQPPTRATETLAAVSDTLTIVWMIRNAIQCLGRALHVYRIAEGSRSNHRLVGFSIHCHWSGWFAGKCRLETCFVYYQTMVSSSRSKKYCPPFTHWALPSIEWKKQLNVNLSVYHHH